MNQYTTIPFIDESQRRFRMVFQIPEASHLDGRLIHDGLHTWMPYEKVWGCRQLGPATSELKQPVELKGRTPVPVPCSEARVWMLEG